MKIIVDNKIPYIHEAVEQIADEVVYLPGSGFTAGDVRDADALVIRTRTRCNRELLEGSKVKFIATATIGFDHIDVDYCDEAGIVWKNCPGCNAGSVEQYLHSVLLLLKRRKWKDGINLIVQPRCQPETRRYLLPGRCRITLFDCKRNARRPRIGNHPTQSGRLLPD